MRYDTLLKRHEGNPVLTPKDYPFGPAEALFNCGQVMHGEKTILLVSVVRADEPTPYLRVAESDDGVAFTWREEPLIRKLADEPFAGLDGWVIDPRVTKIDDAYYICRPGKDALTFLYRTTDWRTAEFVDIIALGHNRVPCLFPERIDGYYWKLDRPSIGDPPRNRGSIWISRSPDLIHWGHFRPVLHPFIHWASFKIGPTPPIRTERGWLEIFHGVKRHCSGARYSLGAMLLDLERPWEIKGMMRNYILTPETEYEHNGRVPDVVFTCGAIADPDARRLRVYYGGADTCICLATCDLDAVIDACLQDG